MKEKYANYEEFERNFVAEREYPPHYQSWNMQLETVLKIRNMRGFKQMLWNVHFDCNFKLRTCCYGNKNVWILKYSSRNLLLASKFRTYNIQEMKKVESRHRCF